MINPKQIEYKPIKSLGMKFANNIFISQELLKRWNIKFTEKDLIKTPIGEVVSLKQEVE